MSVYQDVQDARAVFVNAIGDTNSGYIGNPFMKHPLKTFTVYLNTMEQELIDAGGVTAPDSFFDSQINDYETMTLYLSKLIIQNRDEQILGDAEEFYFLESTDIDQAFGTVNVNNATNVLLYSSRRDIAYVSTTGITTTPGLISTYVTPEDYHITGGVSILPGIFYIDLYAEKTSGGGDLKVYFEVDEVSADGVTHVENVTSGLITDSVKQEHSTVIPAVYGTYRLYTRMPTAHTPTETTNRLMIKLYAFASTGTVDLKYYVNDSRASFLYSTVIEPVPRLVGPTGDVGPVGPQGTQGQQGDTGVGITSITANGAVGTVTYTDSTTDTIALPAGVGITSITANGSVGTVNYTDSTTDTITLPPGPQGPTGPQGPAGTQGAAGPVGPQGPAGADGAQGLTGAQGQQGPAGADGVQGADGPTGPTGPQGSTGAQGPVGAAGPAGPQGPIGSEGPAGPQGATGATGPTGPGIAPSWGQAIGDTHSQSVGVDWLPVNPTNDATSYTGTSDISLVVAQGNTAMGRALKVSYAGYYKLSWQIWWEAVGGEKYVITKYRTSLYGHSTYQTARSCVTYTHPYTYNKFFSHNWIGVIPLAANEEVWVDVKLVGSTNPQPAPESITHRGCYITLERMS